LDTPTPVIRFVKIRVAVIIPPVSNSSETKSASAADIEIGQHISAVNCGDECPIRIRVYAIIENEVIGNVHRAPVALARFCAFRDRGLGCLTCRVYDS
jgi:hypothetical protein